MREHEPCVFVVDDDQSVRTSLANLLATEDYAVEIFASADEYLARVPHPGPACLVLDVQLPGPDGLALQRQLTEEGRVEQIVFITGHGDIPMGIEAMKGGAIDFLPKPFDDDELLCAVAVARSAEDWRQRSEWWKAAHGLRSSHYESSKSSGWSLPGCSTRRSARNWGSRFARLRPIAPA